MAKNRIEKLFPTCVYLGKLPKAQALNRRLLREIEALSRQDKMGREWSQKNYLGGYTSYASLSDLHFRSPSFLEFSERLKPYVEEFARALRWERRGLNLELNALWMNIMPKHTYHAFHLHPHSVVSGAYYVDSPKGSVSLKLEDPRMGLFMNAPLKKANRNEASPFHFEVKPEPGTFVLFESWLKHEVPPNQSARPRISLSFNYSLSSPDAD